MSRYGFSQRAIEIIAGNKIDEARDRGKFDNLRGAGQPLADLNKPYDPDWWAKKMIERENFQDLSKTGARAEAQRREGTKPAP